MLSATRVKIVVKCKTTALCRHPVFASDNHVVCFRCKLLSKAKLCDLNNRCVECQCMSVDSFMQLAVAVDLHTSGVDIFVNCDEKCNLTHSFDLLELLQRWENQKSPDNIQSP